MQIFPQGLSNKTWVKYALKPKQVQLLFVIIQVHDTLVWWITESIFTKYIALTNFILNTQFSSKYSFPSIFSNSVFYIFTSKTFSSLFLTEESKSQKIHMKKIIWMYTPA